jgi:hypothetical protein
MGSHRGERRTAEALDARAGCSRAHCCSHPVGIFRGLARAPTANGKPIDVLGVLPIFKDEMTFKLNHGLDALLDRFVERGVTAVFDPDRRSVMR